MTKTILLLQVGSTTMLSYFKALAMDIPSIANDKTVKSLSRPKFYSKFFRNDRILEMIENSSNGTFLQRFDSFKKTKHILAYSFVRHPFDR